MGSSAFLLNRTFLVHERDSGADVVLAHARNKRRLKSVLDVDLYVRSEIALIEDVDETLRAEVRPRRGKIRILRTDLRRSARERGGQSEGGRKCEIRLWHAAGVIRAQSVEPERAAERKLRVERVAPVEVSGKLRVPAAEGSRSRRHGYDGVDSPERPRRVPKLVFRAETEIAHPTE